uniref:Uncharacterized protein n=1 Tax=viral metagenome TaxID=1070528 RepID=A0A6C0BIU3_9ZZZZ
MATLKTMIKQGFGLGIGFLSAHMIFIFVGILFFIPGYLLFVSQENKTDPTVSKQISGLILMLLGVVLAGGIGFGFLIDAIGDFS